MYGLFLRLTACRGYEQAVLVHTRGIESRAPHIGRSEECEDDEESEFV